MGKSKRKGNKKSRAELLAQVQTKNNNASEIPQDRPPTTPTQQPLLKGVLYYLVQFVSMYFIILVCMKGLNSLDSSAEERQNQQPSEKNDSILNGLVGNENGKGSHQDIVDSRKTNDLLNENEDIVLNDVGSKSVSEQEDVSKEKIVQVSVKENGSISVDANMNKPTTINKSDEGTKGALNSIVDYVTSTILEGSSTKNHYDHIDFTSPLEEYPQLLNINPELRQQFHPVIKFPIQEILEPMETTTSSSSQKMKKVKKQIYRVLDCTSTSGSSELILPEHQTQFREERNKNTSSSSLIGKIFNNNKNQESLYGIGKYDENRIHLYSSQMFQNESNQIDGYDGLRTVHMGIDLGGPVHTKVYSFWNGVVHSRGYNPELGDYGYVIVIQYEFPSSSSSSSEKKKKNQTVWALYGHLDKSIMKKRIGQRIKKGQVIGRIGDVHENGGWRMPHVHFQLSLIEPETHDMPGAVAVKDRSKALEDYPDPRHVLGPLY